MDRQTDRKKNGNATEIDQILFDFFFTDTRMCYYIWSISVAFPCFLALFRLSVSEARPLSVSVALGLSIRFTGTSSTRKKKIAKLIKKKKSTQEKVEWKCLLKQKRIMIVIFFIWFICMEALRTYHYKEYNYITILQCSRLPWSFGAFTSKQCGEIWIGFVLHSSIPICTSKRIIIYMTSIEP